MIIRRSPDCIVDYCSAAATFGPLLVSVQGLLIDTESRKSRSWRPTGLEVWLSDKVLIVPSRDSFDASGMAAPLRLYIYLPTKPIRIPFFARKRLIAVSC